MKGNQMKSTLAVAVVLSGALVLDGCGKGNSSGGAAGAGGPSGGAGSGGSVSGGASGGSGGARMTAGLEDGGVGRSDDAGAAGAGGGAGPNDAGGKADVLSADASPVGGASGGSTAVKPAANARNAASVDQDDMAFWIHPTDPTLSTLVSSDKSGSKVFVYDNAGKVIQTLVPPGKPGNIDVRYGLPLSGNTTDIVAFNDRGTGKVAVYAVDPATRMIARVDDDAIVTATANYGSCLYKNKAGKFYIFVTFEVPGTGRLQQYELADNGAGQVKGTKVREWTFPTKTFGEGCVVDDENATLYYSDEPNGIYAVGAEASDPTPGSLFTKTGENGLVADVEGLTIYFTAAGGGYLIASSQGGNAFKVYDRKAPHAFLGTFTVMGATHTDGVEVTNVDIGGAFTQGCFVAHGGDDPASNFMVKWQEIAAPLGLAVDPSYSPRR
jgi:3-phytase